MKKNLLTLATVFSVTFAYSQTTFDRVYQILQTNCAGYCHNSGNPTGNLQFDVSKQDVMNNLVGVTPDNTTAASRGLLRVYPGDARKSFLFQKINHGLDSHISLQSGEGDPMPQGGAPISEIEREMVRQWIIFGAGDTIYPYADETVITAYYNGFAEARDPSLPIPDPSEGYQIYYGPIFLMPNVEIEFDGKFPLFNTYDAEVHKMNVAMNKESHHMAVFKYHSGNDTLVAPGLKQVNSIVDAADLFFTADVVAQWPNSLEVELPQGTALFWDSSSVLNISYHVLNYSDSIIMAEIYMNVYTRPRQPNTIEMTSYPVRYDGHAQYQGGWDVFSLVILPTGTDTTLSINQWHQDSTHYWNIWSIQAHTHQLGKDYNIYTRTDNGDKDCHVYIGKYNTDHTFNQGFYDWEHPPLRYFDPPLSVDMSKGLIHEAVFNNNTPDTVGFGLKTTDEMFVSYIFFYKTPTPSGVIDPCLVSVDEIENLSFVKLFPNPSANKIHVEWNHDKPLNHASFKIYNLMGSEVLSVSKLKETSFSVDVNELAQGQYLYRITNNGETIASGKFLKE